MYGVFDISQWGEIDIKLEKASRAASECGQFVISQI
jgi:hypothetical protein